MSELNSKLHSKLRIKWDDLKILVVEDEPDLREILMMVFEQEGSHVAAASDGNQALELLKTYKPDLIISDVRMPNCDGIKFLEAVRKQHPTEPPFFLATGFADINEEQARQKGAVSLIYKPFNIQDLFHSLETHLRRHQSFKKWA
jgi:DNA-binding response OmpR family regulator